jgi:hypothetical protein
MNIFPETNLCPWGEDSLISDAEAVIQAEAYIAKYAPKRYLAGEAATLNDVQIMLADIKKSMDMIDACTYISIDYIPKVGK